MTANSVNVGLPTTGRSAFISDFVNLRRCKLGAAPLMAVAGEQDGEPADAIVPGECLPDTTRAESGFFSGIIREPLNGLPAVLPVPRSVVHTFLMHAAAIDGDSVGPRRNLAMPGVGVSVGEQIEALRRIAGDRVAGLIREEPDAAVWSIVQNWPTRFAASRARQLGFAAEDNFDEIIRVYVEDELGGVLPG